MTIDIFFRSSRWDLFPISQRSVCFWAHIVYSKGYNRISAQKKGSKKRDLKPENLQKP